MRFALAMALLVANAPVATGNPKPNSAVTIGGDQAYHDKKRQIEDRSKQAQEAQEIRDKNFDLKVKKITSSICVGCGSAMPSKSNKSKDKKPKFRQDSEE